MSKYEAIRFYPSRKRRHERELVEWDNIYYTVDGLTTPDTEGILSLISNEIDALKRDCVDFTIDAKADFKNILLYAPSTIIEDDVVIRCYVDAVVIIEDYSRTVFWIEKDGLRYTELSPKLEIWLESDNLISDWVNNNMDVPF